MLGIPDRFWWAQRIWGIVSALGFMVTIWMVIQAYGAYSLAQIPVSDPHLPELLRDGAHEELLLGGVFALTAAQGVLSVWVSFSARERVRRRKRAMEGDQEAMPRAALTVDAGLVPTLSGGSLEFLQQASVVDRRVKMTGYLVASLFVVSMAGLLLVVAYGVATTNQAGMSLWGRGTLALLSVGGAAGMVTILVATTRYLPSFLGKPYGVKATDDGLWYYAQTGRKRFLRWEEFQLFEVIPSGNGRHCQEYKLYSGDVIAAWSNYPPASILLSGLAMQEFQQRHQALVNLIVARTQLRPRTFDKKLAEAGSGI